MIRQFFRGLFDKKRRKSAPPRKLADWTPPSPDPVRQPRTPSDPYAMSPRDKRARKRRRQTVRESRRRNRS